MKRHSRIHIIGAFAVAGALLVEHPAAAGAQVRRLGEASDSVPRGLVEALMDPMGSMRMIGGGRPRLVVGTLPSGLAQRLWVPPGSTVLGGIESSGLGLAVIHSTMTEDSLNAAYRREQPKLGWTLPHARVQRPMMGFVAAASASVGDGALEGMFCSGGTTLSIAVTTVDPLTREIRATAMNLPDDRCQPVAAVRAVATPFRTQYPTLTNPPGSGNGFSPIGCSPWSFAGGGGTTRLQTTMPLDDVFAHYGKQLVDSGWTPANNEMVSRTWTRRDSTGALVQLTLMARTQPSAPMCIEIQEDVRSHR